MYKHNTEKIGWETGNDTSVDNVWEKLKELIKRSMIYKEREIKRKELGQKDWWDRSCTRKKREVKRIYNK